MGVGYPLDLIVCSALGIDMYECVYPTHTGRFGNAMAPDGLLKLFAADFAISIEPIDKDCKCDVCQHYTRGYLHHSLKNGGIAPQLETYHAYMRHLMTKLRESILENRFSVFVQTFMSCHYPDSNYPTWVVEALLDTGIELKK